MAPQLLSIPLTRKFCCWAQLSFIPFLNVIHEYHLHHCHPTVSLPKSTCAPPTLIQIHSFFFNYYCVKCTYISLSSSVLLICLGVTTWDSRKYIGLHFWRKLVFLLSAVINYLQLITQRQNLAKFPPSPSTCRLV